MKLVSLMDKKIVQDFLESAALNSGAEFLGSLEWANVLISEGEKVESLGVYNNDQELVAVFNLIKKVIWRNLFYDYLPRGPIFKQNLIAAEQLLIWQFLNDYFKKQGAIFWRVEPVSDIPEIINSQGTINLQPKESLLLNLDLDETELISSFAQKTRYNIHLAKKKGVTVSQGFSESDFNNFWKLMTETGNRDAFKIHNKKHYQNLVTADPNFIKLFLAESGGQVIAAGLFSFYGDKVAYLHGASAYNARQFMAPYLLQWEVIKLAKLGNYKYYDFYGIDAKKWPGVTRFKLGFAGCSVSYCGTRDIILNGIKYYLYNLIRALRRFL